jgi:hypothetical protein
MVTNRAAWGLVLQMVAMLSDYIKGLSVDSNPENSETQNGILVHLIPCNTKSPDPTRLDTFLGATSPSRHIPWFVNGILKVILMSKSHHLYYYIPHELIFLWYLESYL